MQDGPYKCCRKCGETKPLSRFNRDRAARDGHRSICKPCAVTADREWRQHRAIARREVADEERFARLLALDPGFGHWLAGFIDGEGCFYVRRDSRRRQGYQCAMRVAVRLDDAAIIDEIHRCTGLGNVGTQSSHTRKNPKHRPAREWNVTSYADCLALVDLLDAYPLRAKKARDYAIWREALFEWGRVMDAGEIPGSRRGQKGGRGRRDWSRMAKLHAALMAARIYSESPPLF